MLDQFDEDGASDASSIALSDGGGDEVGFATHDLFQVVEFAERGNVDGLRLLLASVGASAEVPNGHEALFEASSAGHAACVEALVAAGVVVDSRAWAPGARVAFGRCCCHRCDKGMECGRTLIEASVILALEGNHTSVLKILLRAGAALDTAAASRLASNEASWALVDAIRTLGNWEEYARHHRTVIVGLVAKMAGSARVPYALASLVASFVSLDGGH